MTVVQPRVADTMGRVERTRRDRPPRRLTFRPCRAAGPATPSFFCGLKRLAVQLGLATGLLWTCLALVLAGLPEATAGAQSNSNSADVCNRTYEVHQAIVAAVPGVTDCAHVTPTHLSGITGTLHLSSKGMPSLKARDFEGLTALEELSLHSNALRSLPAGVFDGLTALKVLDLHHNYLESLSAGTFDGLTALEDLALHGNALTSISADAFDGLTALKVLSLRGNSLTSLPAGAFDGLTALETVFLHRNALQALPAGVFEGLAALKYLGLHDNRLTSVAAGALDGLTALEKLHLHDNQLASLPPGIFDELTALRLLHLHENQLGQLPAEVFDELTALETLTLHDNHLASLPEGVFDELTGVQELTVYDNLLASLPEGIFGKNTALGRLWLQGNPGAPFSPAVNAGGDQAVQTGAPVTLSGTVAGAWGDNVIWQWTQVKGADSDTELTGPGAVTLDHANAASATFTAPSTPATLYFRLIAAPVPGANPGRGLVASTAERVTITVSDDGEAATDVCARTPAVRDAIVEAVAGVADCADLVPADLAAITGTLDLSDQAITSLTAIDFGGLGSVTSLNLDDNRLASLPGGVFDGLTGLTTLRLDGNDLASLPAGVFDELTGLGWLFLRDNELISLPAHAFDRLTSLRVLYLAKNQLTSLEEDVFDELGALEVLALYGNRLETLPMGLFDGLGSLKRLNLYDTGLATLPRNIFKGNRALTALSLDNNPGTPFSPVAHAGADKGAPMGATTTLSGTATGAWGDNVRWEWTQVRGPNSNTAVTGADAVALTGENTATPSFTMPDTPATLHFKLVVTPVPGASRLSGVAASAADHVTVTVFSDVCSRTAAVRDAIVAAVPGVIDCAEVTHTHLSGITGDLRLSNEGITSLKANDFSGLGAVTGLHLDDNALASLPVGAFEGLAALEELLLYGNHLASLPTGVFNGLTALEGLYLNDNALTSLPGDVFDGLSAMEELTLQENDLGSLPENVLEKLTSLTRLRLDNNPGAPFRPVANAGSDQSADAGAQVTLSGTATGAWGDNVTWKWTQVDGVDSDNKVTGPGAVTLTGATTATPSFTAGTTAEALHFKLIVKPVPGAEARYGRLASTASRVTVEVSAGKPTGTITLNPPVTASEGGYASFEVERSGANLGHEVCYVFETLDTGTATPEEDFHTISRQMRMDADQGSQMVRVQAKRDDIDTVADNENETVHARISEARYCHDPANTVQIVDATQIWTLLEPPHPTANVEGPPGHDGHNRFTMDLVLSDPASNTPSELEGQVIKASGGTLGNVEPVDGRTDRWTFTVDPDGPGDVVVTIEGKASCNEPGALCTKGGEPFTERIETTVSGPGGAPAAPESCATDRTHADWCTEMTAGTHDSGGLTFVGWKAYDRYGTLDDTVIEFAGTRWWLTHIQHGPHNGSHWMSVKLTSYVPRGTVFDLGGTKFIANSASEYPKLGVYAWNLSSSFSWLDGQKVTVSANLPPLLTGATVDGDQLALTYAEDLDTGSVPTADAFTVKKIPQSGSEQGVALSGSPVIAGNKVTLTLASPVLPTDTVTVSYTVPASNPVQDEAGLDALALTDRTVTVEGAQEQGTTVRTTQPPPLVVEFVDVPKEHDGSTRFEIGIVFSEPPHERNNGQIKTQVKVGNAIKRGMSRAKTNGVFDNAHRTMRIDPRNNRAITVRVQATTHCSDRHSLCTADGGRLEQEISTTIPGPVAISVADARVEEADGAELVFAVTLDRARHDEVRVDYATEDDSARAGTDYRATSGTLVFDAGDTQKTVRVQVLDDAHDEGEETMKLILSNPVGARIADGEATGTIENTDLMPKAWLSRFGRTVAEQMFEAADHRLRTRPPPGRQGSIAGVPVAHGNAEDSEEQARELAREQQARQLARWTDEEHLEPESRTFTGRDLLTRSSFTLSAGGTEPDAVIGSLWGRGAISSFSGTEDELNLDGEVASTMLGADLSTDKGAAGAMLAHSRGDGTYTEGEHGGTVESTLTGVYTYGRYALSRRLALWGIAGYGEGTLDLTPQGQKTIETDMDLAMAALGLRGVVVEAPAEGGAEVALTTDALGVRTTTDAVAGELVATEATVTRLRLGAESAWRGLTLGAGALSPRLELGLRHDAGDAETGFGIDVGAGLGWSDPTRGFSAEVQARGLLTHESEGLSERGFAGSIGYDPRPGSDRGLSLTLRQSVGAQASGGMDNLLGHRTLEGLGAGSGDELSQRRLELRIGYGLPVLGGRFTATPELGFGLSDDARDYRAGWRLGLSRTGHAAVELNVKATRRESAGADAPEHGVALSLDARW